MVSKVIVKWLKLTFVLSTASFLIIQVHMRFSTSGDLTDSEMAIVKSHVDAGRGATVRNESSPVAKRPSSIVSSPQNRDESAPTEDEISSFDIRQIIESHNSRADVFNEAEFGPVESVEYVVVVQVHNRTKYLEQLIHSLSKAKGIERTMQIYPDRYPGQDPRDCQRDIGKEKAKEIQCQNWRTPDKYGHYRVAQYSQVKHHWWWKMNYVFDGIPRLRNYSGWVLRLEEDHYVSPDFIHTFDFMVKNKDSLCGECSVITLGVYLKSYGAYSASMNQLAVFPWFSSRHNMGMAINRATWTSLHDCSEMFCTYDDYNWDWSLMHMNLKCLKRAMTVIYARSPRVFHVGDCGIHHTGKQCTADSSATKVRTILESVKEKLFPERFEIWERSSRTLKAPKENGGWGDIRDHELCRNNSYFHHQLNSEHNSQQ